MSNAAREIVFDVFGRRVLVEKSADAWSAFYLGGEGKRRGATDLRIPSDVDESGLEQYLADVCHEWATARHPTVRRLT